MPLHQQRLIEQVESYVCQNLSATHLSVPDIASGIGISERKLFRILKGALNTTPNKLIQTIRLERAKELIELGEFATVAEVSYAVGYNRPDYFASLFQKKFGEKPKSYSMRWGVIVLSESMTE